MVEEPNHYVKVINVTDILCMLSSVPMHMPTLITLSGMLSEYICDKDYLHIHQEGWNEDCYIHHSTKM